MGLISPRKAIPNRILEPAWQLLLGLVVFACGLLITTRYFHSVDEVSMFVTAVNIVDRGEMHVNQMAYSLWGIRPGEEVIKLNANGDVYSNKSPVVIAFMIPLVALGKLIPALGKVRAALLLGPFLTAATTALLYAFARHLGYARFTSSITAFLFAFCTMALPYMQTAFGGPLASFGLLLALWAVEKHIGVDEQPSPTSSRRIRFSGAVLCGIGMVLAIGSNLVYILLIPIFALAIVVKHRFHRSSLRRYVSQLVWFGLPLGLMGTGLLIYNFVRFGAWLEAGYHFSPGQEGFSTPLWWGLLGLTVSPARGFLWYNPPALLALLSWPRFHRAQRFLSLVMLSVIGMHLIAFGTWWAWWGGWSWGPRFLLPIVPYTILVSLPFLQSALGGASIKRTGMVLIATLGLAVQVAGVAVDFNLYEQELDAHFPAPPDQPLRYHHNPALVYDVARSPILEHWRRLCAGTIQLGWWSGDNQPRLSTTLATILHNQKPKDVIIFLVPELLYELLDNPNLPPIHGLPFNLPAEDARAQIVFERALRDAERVWLITWYGPGDTENWYEEQLRQEWASVSEEWGDDLRLLLMARPPHTDHRSENATTFDSIRLFAYSLQRSHDTLFVEIAWQAVESIPQDYITFVHVLDSEMHLIAQQDRPPLGGYRPTTSWVPGEIVVDRFAFPLSGKQLAEAQVMIGWYEWPSLERLPVRNEIGKSVEGNALLIGDTK